MNMAYISFRSITPAQRAQRILGREGIETILQRTPRYMQQQGCGYALRVRQHELDRALQVIKRNRIVYQKFYLPADGGEDKYGLS